MAEFGSLVVLALIVRREMQEIYSLIESAFRAELLSRRVERKAEVVGAGTGVGKCTCTHIYLCDEDAKPMRCFVQQWTPREDGQSSEPFLVGEIEYSQ